MLPCIVTPPDTWSVLSIADRSQFKAPLKFFKNLKLECLDRSSTLEVIDNLRVLVHFLLEYKNLLCSKRTI